MRIYLSGKITGNDNYYAEFINAEIAVKRQYSKAEVINPAKCNQFLVGDCPTLPYEDLMNVCHAMLCSCDTICMMPNWQNSIGARMEKSWAEERGITVIYIPYED